LTFDLLTSNLVCDLHVSWATFTSISGFLAIFILLLSAGTGKTDEQNGRTNWVMEYSA